MTGQQVKASLPWQTKWDSGVRLHDRKPYNSLLDPHCKVRS